MQYLQSIEIVSILLELIDVSDISYTAMDIWINNRHVVYIWIITVQSRILVGISRFKTID